MKFAGTIIMYFILIIITLTKPAFMGNNFTINRNIVDFIVQFIPHVRNSNIRKTALLLKYKSA